MNPFDPLDRMENAHLAVRMAALHVEDTDMLELAAEACANVNVDLARAVAAVQLSTGASPRTALREMAGALMRSHDLIAQHIEAEAAKMRNVSPADIIGPAVL